MRGKKSLSVGLVPLGLLLAAVVGCSGGGGGGGSAAAIDVAAFGRIQGFGSIFVNGIEYETSEADFSGGIDENDLDEGMMVTVLGSVNDDGLTGTADSVDYRDNLHGPISSINAVANSFVAMGQIVIVYSSTEFADALTFDQLAVDDIVEVSGILDAQENIVGTFIERTDETCATIEEIDVKGTLSNLDPDAHTFSIGGLTVDYSGADLSDLPGGPTEGLFVGVKSNECPIDDTLVATRVEAEGEFGQIGENEDGGQGETQGFVTAITSPTEFELSGQPVRVTDQTQFDGLTPDEIALNLQLEVKGTIVDDGVLLASEIQLLE